MALTPSFAQLAPTESPGTLKPQPTKPIPVEKKAVADVPSEEVIELSPFQVRADNNGYFQTNSMSGTRMNSKIEDLGQSITVMTKEQMIDFAMLDINDHRGHPESVQERARRPELSASRTLREIAREHRQRRLLLAYQL
eukprot:gene48849-59810_t